MAYEVNTIQNSYQQLKAHVIEHATRRQLSADVVTDLKLSFEKQINSKRRVSCIDSVEELIRILEKRNEINSFKVDILEKIIRTIGADKARYLSHCELISDANSDMNVNTLSNPSASVPQDVDNYGYPTQGWCPNENERHSHVNINNTHVNNHMPSAEDTQRQQCNHHYSVHNIHNHNHRRLKSEVIELICSDIGYKWKDLARSLEIKEGIIYDIDTAYRINAVKCRSMLEEYENTIKPCELNSKLLTALVKARRRDLAEKVQDRLFQD